jgi:hypothetical protein
VNRFSVLDDLCSFRTLDSVDHLDLNWAGLMLRKVAVCSAVAADLQRGLDLSLEGDVEINPAYRDAQDTIWEHPVASLSSPLVRNTADILTRLSRAGFPSNDAVEAYLSSVPMEHRPQDPGAYLSNQFLTLRDFYTEAAARGPAWLCGGIDLVDR